MKIKERVIKETKNSGYKKGTLYSKNPSAIEYIEKHYPETAKEFQRLQFEQYDIFCKKQMDYGPSNIASDILSQILSGCFGVIHSAVFIISLLHIFYIIL